MPLPVAAAAAPAAKALSPLIGGVISGAGSLISGLFGGIFGNRAQKKANETNIMLARENNQLQRDLANQKYEKDLEQWNRQNAYNTPLAQSKRLLEANLNPALQNVSTGVATSSPEMAVAPTTAPQVQPVDAMANSMQGIGNAVSQGVSTYFDMAMKNEQLKTLKIDNQTRATENLLRLEDLDAGRAWKDAQRSHERQKERSTWLQNMYLPQVTEMDLAVKDMGRRVQEVQMQGIVYDNAMKHLQLEHLPEQYRAEISKMMAEISAIYAQRDLSVKQKDSIAEDITKKKWQNRVDAATEKDIVLSVRAAVKKAYNDSVPTLDQQWDKDYEAWDKRLRNGTADFSDYTIRAFGHGLRAATQIGGNLLGGLRGR